MGHGMHQGTLDLMVEFALGELASGEDARIRALVRRAAARWPDEKALTICFALTSASASLDEAMRGQSVRGAVDAGYRFAALVAADVLAIEAMRDGPVLGRDLGQFWRRVDPYFLNL